MARSRLKVSHAPPIGRALIGRREGDEVTVTLDDRVLELEILEVRYVAQPPDDDSDMPWMRDQGAWGGDSVPLAK